jgi:hypothetical protein
MSHVSTAVLLLVASNVFMTLAWYWHVNGLKEKPWLIAAFVSWGIALFEYLLQVPANRLAARSMSFGQMKIMQEIIALTVFVPVAIFVLGERPRLGYFLAAGCLCAAAYFVFWFEK